jgi:signal transduction histidine kinase/ligand-binding sensor domain-containing protein
MWFGAEYAVYRMKNGVVTEWRKRLRGGSIAEDSAGGLWLTDLESAFRYRQLRLTETVRPGFPHRLESMYGDRRGTLWMGSDDSGFCRWHDKKLTCFKGADANANDVLAFHEDRSGAVWIATGNGLKRWKEGVLETWTTKDGLASNQTASFYETGGGSLWIGSENGGLTRYKDGRFSRVTIDNGLFDNVAFAILEDDDGNLWMSCNRGIYRVSLRELEECADGRRRTVQSYSYGVADGMLSRECNGAFPAGWRSTDGKLWFTTLNGAVAIDPNRIRIGRAPSVKIEEVNSGGPVTAGTAVRLGRGQENLEIRYTALHCARPKQAHFKVKLEGLDRDWTDMGLSRSVHYSHLPPGRFTFRVIADNGEGIWDLSGARMKLSIAGPYYTTWWFLSLCVLAAALITAVAWRMRMAGLIHARELQRRFLHRLIQSQEQERKRLAGELHDSLAQRLTIIKNLALLDGRAGAPSGGEKMGLIATEAGESLREVRDISYALRPYQLDYLGLRAALEALVKKAASLGQTEFIGDFTGIEDSVGEDEEINLYRIVQECLQNIVKHAQARHAEVFVSRNGNRVCLQITDDGVGFRADENHAGLGLTSISERVQLIGGKLTIQSTPGQGTSLRIELAVKTRDARKRNQAH